MSHEPVWCPVLRPTKADFDKPFCKYVAAVFRKNPDLPMFKVIPPEGWKPRKGKFPDLKNVKINTAIRQNVFGSKGIYRCIFVEQKEMSVAEFKAIAEKEGSMSPEIKKQANTSDDALLERHFWSNVTLKPPLYGSDTPVSFFDKKLPNGGWNMNDLGDLLKTKDVPPIPGVTSPMTYFGMWRSFFGWHKEDADLYSVNYLHFGAPKIWYCISPADQERFDRMVQGIFPELHRACPAFVRHKDILVSPTMLRTHGIPFMQAKQMAGEFVVLNAAAYHSGFNLGFNCAEAINFALKEWIEVGKAANHCTCSALKDCVRISMKIFDPKWVDPYELSSSEDEEEEEEEEEKPSPRSKSRRTSRKTAATASAKRPRGRRAAAAAAEEEEEGEEEEEDDQGEEEEEEEQPSSKRQKAADKKAAAAPPASPTGRSKRGAADAGVSYQGLRSEVQLTSAMARAARAALRGRGRPARKSAQMGLAVIRAAIASQAPAAAATPAAGSSRGRKAATPAAATPSGAAAPTSSRRSAAAAAAAAGVSAARSSGRGRKASGLALTGMTQAKLEAAASGSGEAGEVAAFDPSQADPSVDGEPVAIVGEDGQARSSRGAQRRFFFLVQKMAQPAKSRGMVLLRWLKQGSDGLYRPTSSMWEEKPGCLVPVRTQAVTPADKKLGGYKLLTLRSRILDTDLQE